MIFFRQSLKDAVQALSKGYSEGITEDEVLSIINDVLPRIRDKLKELFPQDKPSGMDAWNAVREDAESLFEPLVAKHDMLKVLYVTSKFKNNKNIGTAITEEGLKEVAG